MFVDAADVEEGARLNFDLCIVGAGAAGLVIANEFIDSRLRVALLEGGGLEFDDASQDIYLGTSEGYFDLDIGRLRYFGGTTNHWTNYCRRPTFEDFTARDWNPLLGWPIVIEELDPYFPRAAEICGVVDDFGREIWAERLDVAPTRIDTEEVMGETTLIGRGKRFGEDFRRPIQASESVQCFLNSSCVAFIEHPSDALVEAVTIRGSDGRTFEIAAQRFVLACGGIENARLMLNSTGKNPQGLGNSTDQVGRYFADHRIVRLGTAEIRVGDLGLARKHGGWRVENGMTVLPHYQTSRAAADAREIGRAIIRLSPATSDGRWSILSRRLERVLPGWFTDWGSMDEIKPFNMDAFSEPFPEPDNRITLNNEVDALGLRRVTLRYDPSAAEDTALYGAAELFGGVVAVDRSGVVMRTYDAAERDRFWLNFGHHHYSTTRMSDDPSTGVVDRDLRVHDASNLFVCGTSVYPSGGLMTPTMTIVALSLRLADALRNEFET